MPPKKPIQSPAPTPHPTPFLTPDPKTNALLLQVKAVPNASRTQLAGLLGDSLKIKVAQPPEDGRANRAIIEFLAHLLQLPSARITLVSSPSNPRKLFRLEGIPADLARQRLQSALAAR